MLGMIKNKNKYTYSGIFLSLFHFISYQPQLIHDTLFSIQYAWYKSQLFGGLGIYVGAVMVGVDASSGGISQQALNPIVSITLFAVAQVYIVCCGCKMPGVCCVLGYSLFFLSPTLMVIPSILTDTECTGLRAQRVLVEPPRHRGTIRRRRINAYHQKVLSLSFINEWS
jgi:hypothetical protein